MNRTSNHSAVVFLAPITGLFFLIVGSANAGDSALRFSDVATESGIALKMVCGETPSRHILEANGGGVALLDYDNDGDLDLFFANGATLALPEKGPGSRLYANRGDGSFVDVTREAGIDLTRWAMGVAVGDYDSDGCQDIYVTCYGANVLLRNECKSKPVRFVDVSDAAGVADPRWGSSAAFGDIDRDHDLDLYVVNYLEFDVHNPPAPRSKYKGVEVMPGPAGLKPQADVLYENLGNGHFKDITEASGCGAVKPGYGLGVIIVDLQSDGQQEILVGNDSTENFLFKRQSNGKFNDIGVISGVAANYDGINQATMGIAVGDVDGNGFCDFFSTNFSNDTNTLHVNLGNDFFEDRTRQFGLGMVSYPFLSWGTGFYDFDSDGDEDLFIASGHVYPEAATHKIDTDYKQPILLFEREAKRFRRVEVAGDMRSEKYAARSTAFGDLDGDGDVDVVMTTLNGPVHLFRNDTPYRNRIVVALDYRPGNLRGLGSRVDLTSGDELRRRWIHGGSYQSVDAPHAYFGLGKASKELRLRITWPDGKTIERCDIPVNQRITVDTKGNIKSTPLSG